MNIDHCIVTVTVLFRLALICLIVQCVSVQCVSVQCVSVQCVRLSKAHTLGFSYNA